MPVLQISLTFLGIFLLPGYFCARIVGFPARVFDPRTLTFASLFGITVVTQVTYLSSLLFGFSVSVVIAASIGTTLILGLAWRSVSLKNPPTAGSATYGKLSHPFIVCFLLLAVVVLTVIVQTTFTVGERLYLPDGARDFMVRVETIQAILKTGVPPRNTFADYGVQPPMINHYFLFLTCAILSLVAKVSASLSWSFITFTGNSIFLSTVFIFVQRAGKSTRVALLALGLLFCAGFDTVMLVLNYLWERFHNGWMPPFPKSIFEIEDFWVGNPHVSSFITQMTAAPHHIFAFSGVLLAVLLLTAESFEVNLRSVLRGLFAAMVLSFFICSSFGSGVSAGLGLGLLTLFLGWKRRWRACFTLSAVGTVAFLFMAPHLKMIFQHPPPVKILWQLRPVERLWGGAVFTHFWGKSLVPRILDNIAHFSLEFGVLLILGYFGMRACQRRPSSLTHLALNAIGLASLVVMLFLRTIGENMATMGAIPFTFLVTYYAAEGLSEVWPRLRERLVWRSSLVFALGLQSTVLLWVAVSIPTSLIQPDEKLIAIDYAQKMAIQTMDAMTDLQTYRVQVLPPWRNLGNDTLSSRIPVFSERARALYVSDGAVYYGADRTLLESYLASLCSIYRGDNPKWRSGIATFDFKTAALAAPWHDYMDLARSCFFPEKPISSDNLAAFIRRFEVDFLLIEPDQTGLPAGIGELKELGFGYKLLDVRGLNAKGTAYLLTKKLSR